MCACLLRRNPVLQCPPPDKGAGKGAGTSAMRPRGLSIRSLNAAERDVGSTLCSNASSKRKSDELGAVEEEEKATKRITRDTLAEHGLATQIARQAASASAQAADQLPPLDRTDLSKNTVQALKQYMSAAGLDTVGNKKQLVDRLAAHFSAADAAPIEADPSPALAEEAAPDEAHAMQAEPPADDVEHVRATARVQAAEKAREAVNWTLTILQTWATERPEVTEQERAKVEGMCTNFTSWLDDVEAKQAGLALTDPPAFLSSAVASKLEVIELEVRKLIKKPKPKPPKIKPNTTSTNETETNGTASDGISSAGTGAGDASDGDATAQGDEELPAHDEL